MISIKIFQSTLPREERHSAVKSTSCPMLISIHAPTRGATNLLCFLFAKMRFQSTLPREERQLRSTFNISLFKFQSTLPREERQILGGYCTSALIFQSTLPREERRQSSNSALGSVQFQSTLPREERPTPPTPPTPSANFNPRSHERSDCFISTKTNIGKISIHAPTRGATAYSTSSASYSFYFNPRSHERSDDNALMLSTYSKIFQSTLPREERL